MDEQQVGNAPSNQHMHITHAGWMYVALVVIAFAAVIGTGFGVYYLQQRQVESLEKALSEKSGMKVANTKEITAATATTEFNRQAPFAFSYPSDWTMAVDTPLNSASSVANYDQYSINFTAPGSIQETLVDRSVAYSKGASIGIGVSRSTEKSIDELMAQSGFKSKYPNAVKTTVASSPAVVFTAVLSDSAEQQITLMIRNNMSYKIIFWPAGKAADSPYLSTYRAVVESFKFK